MSSPARAGCARCASTMATWQARRWAVVYYALLEDDVIYLITAYAKVDKRDLTADEKRLFKALVKELTDGRKN